MCETIGRCQFLDLQYERINTSLLSEFCSHRFLPKKDKPRSDLISSPNLYDENLRLAEIETKTFTPVSIRAVDLLIVMIRKSRHMTSKKKAEANLLNERSTAYLIEIYLSGTHSFKSVFLEYPMPATDGSVELFNIMAEEESNDGQTVEEFLDELAPNNSAVFLLHGRDGLTVTDDKWLNFEKRWSHLKTTLLVSEHMSRISTEVLTG